MFPWQGCQLGQHRAICKTYAEGILKVGTAEVKNMAEQPLSDWFLKMSAREGNNEAFNKLKLFAQVCRHDLGNATSQGIYILIPTVRTLLPTCHRKPKIINR